ncbi:MAG: CpsD/CapB family tyrosine-protein kinase [Clostridia bacterium]|nr:CpsD/CapB family tyrosine-protein kinase [Clostridia bacterium]
MANTTTTKNPNENLLINDIRKKVTFSIVEAYKNIRTNTIALMTKKDAKVLAISSPNASEGKSTTALNVAITVSQLEKKVLIIDADAHRPSLHKKLKIENDLGILNLIVDDSNLADAIHSHNNNLDVITCGTNTSKPSELLNSEKFDELLEKLKEKYDYIIIDTPPINPVSDALVIAQKVDAIILVVRAASTTHEAFRKALKSLGVLELKVDGVIINGADPRPKGYYKSKYSYYRYGKTYY